MKKKWGYGVVYQDVTRNSNISADAKGLYAYLSVFCGDSDECYPSVETINNIKNNIDYQLIADMYNATCISFPKAGKGT